MRINAIELTNFGKFSKTKIGLGSGLNLILGPNEAGKSTIQTALKTAFFGERKAHERWKRWGTENPECSIVVDYELPDGATWTLRRDLAKNEVQLAQTAGGEVLAKGPTNVSKLVGEHLGLDNADTFLNTVFVCSGELANDLGSIAASLRARVEAILVGSGGGSITKATKDMDARYKRLVGTVSQGGAGGTMGELLAQEKKLKADLAQAEQASQLRKEYVDQLEQTKETLAAKEKRLNLVKGLIDAVQSRLTIEDQLEKKSARRKKLRLKIERLKTDSDRIESINVEMDKLAKYQGVSALDAAALQNKIDMRNEKQIELTAANDGGRVEAAARARSSLIALIVSATVGLAGLVLIGLGQTIPGALVFVIGLAGVAAGFWMRRPGVRAPDDRSLYIHNEIKRLESDIKEALQTTGATDLDSFFSQQNRHESLAKEKANIKHAGSIILEDTSEEALNKEFDELLDQSQVLGRQLKTATSADLSTEEIFAHERELSYLKPEVDSLKQQHDKLVGRLASHSELAGAPISDIQAELNYVSERLAATERHARATAMASEEISRIATEISHQVAPQIAGDASDYLTKLTNGRYKKIGLGVTFAPTLVGESRELGTAVLSTGTADQLYFAVRLAAADLISGDACPPLILDDPFVYFDADRLAAARDIVKSLAAKKQIIFFAHRDEYADWPGQVVKLETGDRPN
ncbi:MAG TPA: hypothetical protein ENI11_03625 [Actinobacteria bacterium]|nr:hypothetical protein [Actinomycetota bacterium]